MGLEHALLVALRELPASGLELTRRFERSIGNFWSASHQQIYRTLARMEDDGWIESETVEQAGRPNKKVCTVTAAGAQALSDWLAATPDPEPLRSSLAVQMRGASYGDRSAVLESVRHHLAEHRARLGVYQHFMTRDYPDPSSLKGQELDHYLVLRGGLITEQGWIDWLTEYLDAHLGNAPDSEGTS